MNSPKGQRWGKCTGCAKPAQADHAPFCSARCAQVDLGRWLGGHYAIPSRGPVEYEDGMPQAGNGNLADNDNLASPD